MKNVAKTKIVATIGPSTWDNEILQKMYENGMRLARINASFADEAELERVSKQLRDISPRIATILDTQGTKIRVRGLAKEVEVKDTLVLSSVDNPNENIIKVTYPTLHEDVVIGTKIMLDDGNIQLIVKQIKGTEVLCDVIQSGILKPNKTVNIPSVNLNFPALTEKDEKDIIYAANHGFDFISASFVRSKEDILLVRKLIGENGTKVIAKIENEQGVANFDEILKETDAVMIARGDMGVEMDLEDVPIIQKQLIFKCRQAGKPVIVATQMLESMRENKRPTRAEVSDVANAVMDGTDCVMLSAETSTGNYPVEAVQTMNRIAMKTEAIMKLSPIEGKTSAGEHEDCLGLTVCKLTEEIGIKGIIIISNSEGIVGSVSRHRPNVPIYVLNSSIKTVRENAIYRGVKTFHIKELSDDRDANVILAVEKVYGSGELDLLDKIAIISGSSIKNKDSDSILEILTVKDILNL
ncbi:MAG TPA: pyruvate kinase [Candidatus Dojkabacteria bacterium]|nr:pyruvate kinase [Candidatus Dojkabacteria bacterium]